MPHVAVYQSGNTTSIAGASHGPNAHLGLSLLVFFCINPPFGRYSVLATSLDPLRTWVKIQNHVQFLCLPFAACWGKIVAHWSTQNKTFEARTPDLNALLLQAPRMTKESTAEALVEETDKFLSNSLGTIGVFLSLSFSFPLASKIPSKMFIPLCAWFLSDR